MAEENKGRVFTGKNLSQQEKTMETFQLTGGKASDLEATKEASKDIQAVRDVAEEVRKFFVAEVDSEAKKIDPEKDSKKEAYDFFSPIISGRVQKFKNKLQNGESIEEVTVKDEASKVAKQLTSYTSDLLTKPISDIVSSHIKIKNLEEADSYSDIEQKIEDSGAGSLRDLMNFFIQTKELVSKPGPGMDMKVLNETLTKHNILLNGVAILLKELGIKNPSFENSEKNFEDALKTFNPKSVEGVQKESKTETVKETTKTATEKTETKTLESVKEETKSIESVKSETTKIETAKETSAPIEKKEAPTIEPAAAAKLMETAAPKTEAPIAKTETTKPSIEGVAEPKKTESPAAAPTAPATPVTSTTAPSIQKTEAPAQTPESVKSETGTIEAASEMGESAEAEAPASPFQNLLESLGLGSLLGGSEKSATGSGILEKGSGVSAAAQKTAGVLPTVQKSTPISIESIKQAEQVVKPPSTVQAKMESSPLKMTKEVPAPAPKSTESAASSQASEGKMEGAEEEISSGVETKSESTVKKSETPGGETMEGQKGGSSDEVLSAILNVMTEIRETLNGPLIVTSSGNKFD